MRSNRLLFRLVVCLSVVCCVSCNAPGKGPKAERGYARAKPVVTALDSFRRAKGQYPDSLNQLVPQFLPAAALETPTRTQERYPLEYQQSDGNFTLTFRYVGPGMNYCTIEGTRLSLIHI